MSPPRAEGYCVQERFCFSRLLVASLARPDSQHCVFLQLSDCLQFFSSTISVISRPSLTYGQSQPSVDDFLGFSLSVFGAGKAGPTHKLVKTLVKQQSSIPHFTLSYLPVTPIIIFVFLDYHRARAVTLIDISSITPRSLPQAATASSEPTAPCAKSE